MKHAGLLFHAPRKKPPLISSGGQTVKEPRSLCACGRKESPIIFFGDMCGEENTSQAASVEFVRRRRTNYARSRLHPPLVKKEYFLTVSKNRRSGRSGGLPYFCSVNWRAAAPRGARAAAATAAAAKTRPPSPRRCPDAAAACRRRTRANSTRRRGCRYTARRC